MHRLIQFFGWTILISALSTCNAESRSITAVYVNKILTVSIPYEAARSGEAELKAEVLSPEDRMLGQSTRTMHVSQKSANWETKIALDESVPLDELIWYRLRFTLRYTGDATANLEETRSISEILERPILRVLGQRKYIAGAPVAMRILVSSTALHGEPTAITEGTVRIEVMDVSKKATTLFTGRLDHHGSAAAEFRFPEGLKGSCTIHIVADTALGSVESTETVQIEDQAAVLLTSEKPIYQPSQTIHLRALALNRADHHAVVGRGLSFEVEDSRGNKVFRKSVSTDKFGVASAEFTLADEVNLGTYHVHVLMGENSGSAAEIAVNVERYVLPKFRVAVTFANKDGRQKRDYRPGDHVTGTVKANYFFGKPVKNSAVTLQATAMDVELFTAVKTEGRTDENGEFRFDFMLPQFFAGDGKRHGAAPVLVEATVKDATDHAETRGEPITVSQSPLVITAVPEGGSFVLGLVNEIYVLVSYPDGTPAKASLEIRTGDARQSTKTDEAGIATIRIAGDNTNRNLQIKADDRRGNHAAENVQLETRSGEDQLIVHTLRAIYKPGDSMEITVFSTRHKGTAYVDLIHEGQTILTRDVEIEDGRADLELAVTPEMCGMLLANVYTIAHNSRTVASQSLVFVQPNEELRIEATTDAKSYLPGSEAKVNFQVTNQKGEGVTAALGLEIVDQAVFALAEKQPGFAKVFFYLEQELLKPRYEIHSLSSTQIVETPESESAQKQDREARVLFAAAETVTVNTLDAETGRALPDSQRSDFHGRYLNAFLEYVKDLAAKMTDEKRALDVSNTFMALKDADGRAPHDAWGTELRIEAASGRGISNRWFIVRSAGPDRQFNTADDLTVWMEPQSQSAQASTGRSWREARHGLITVQMEHNRGPETGLAQITGTVMDATGAVIPTAHIQILRVEDGSKREAVADAAGSFTFAALKPGRYQIRATSPGFETSVRTIAVEARDLGVLSVRLDVGAQTQTITVNAAAIMLNTESVGLGGNGTGVMGGVFAAAPMKRRAALKGEMAGLADEGRDKDARSGSAEATPDHVRSYFPEALYINPEILTDGAGKATITIPIADSITTWRMAMFASTVNGALGTGTSELKVFQDFFVDLDLPVTLSQGDKVTIPVAVYNYAGRKGEVHLSVKPDDWYSLQSPIEQSIKVEPGAVGSARFTITANRIGKFSLTVSGRMHGQSEREDTVVREVEVVPNGEAKEMVFNGQVDSNVRQSVIFPANAIPDASKIFVRLYPGPLSQVIEGMDGILRMPYGCFEQTSSSTYPNVLALDYMKRTKKLTPEVHAKAEGFIATGYQRLLTFEVPGGGFSWFGRAPANKILTAYGLMEFHDMSRVYDVDPQVIARTRDWLIHQQQPDGSWKPDTQFINEGATNRFNSDLVRITAYIAWALESAEYNGPALEKARQFVEQHADGKLDAYTLAVVANFAVENSKDSEFTRHALQLLSDAVQQKGEFRWWSADETSVYSTGDSAAIETTGLALQAYLKAGGYRDLVRKSLSWIAQKKGGDGNWGTTQATIMALRALLLASEQSGSDALGTVDVLLNGAKVATLDMNRENNDLLHQLVLPGRVDSGGEVELRFVGEGSMAYQIAGRYFVPWQNASEMEPLAIAVKYDRTHLAQDEVATGTATIVNKTDKTAKMVMVDLGIPPGFDLLSEDLQAMVERSANAKSGRLEKFSLTATQAILYFDSISPRDSFEIHFRLKAKYPMRASGFASRVYEYYDPKVNGTEKPVAFEVSAH